MPAHDTVVRMTTEELLDSLLIEARHALGDLDNGSNKVADVIERISSLKYAEGTLAGFVQTLSIIDQEMAKRLAPRVEDFISEAIAARLLLG